MKTRRQWSWAGAVAAGVMILGGSTLAQAATICPPPDRYIAYNVEFFNSMIPRVGGPVDQHRASLIITSPTISARPLDRSRFIVLRQATLLAISIPFRS